MYEILSQSIIFRGLKGEEIKAELEKVHYQVKEYGEGSLVASRDEEVTSLIILVKGSVKGEMLDFTGKVIKIEDIEAPRPLAPAFLFGSHNKYPVDIITREKAMVLVLPRSSVLRLLQGNDTILVNYLDAIATQAQFLSNRLYFLSFKTLREKLVQYIFQELKPGTDHLFLTRTQQELAEFFAVARPSVARALAELERNGWLEVKGKSIRIINRQQLATLMNNPDK
jgi:CRP-like cAMP-binding protein